MLFNFNIGQMHKQKKNKKSVFLNMFVALLKAIYAENLRIVFVLSLLKSVHF